LDELEAFLQKMLDVPVERGDSEPESPVPPAEPVARSVPDPVISAAPSREPTFEKSVELEELPELPDDPPPATLPLPPPKPLKRILDTERNTFQPSGAPFSWHWPVLAVNRLYDAPTQLAGPAGEWLRDSGRTIVGWIGVSLIVIAAAWVVVDWLAWMW
jgi:hypothetical protein